MTRTEYNEMVAAVVSAERDRLADSLSAIFAREGHNMDVLINVIAKSVESQPAVAANVVTAILEKAGLLSPGV